MQAMILAAGILVRHMIFRYDRSMRWDTSSAELKRPESGAPPERIYRPARKHGARGRAAMQSAISFVVARAEHCGRYEGAA